MYSQELPKPLDFTAETTTLYLRAQTPHVPSLTSFTLSAADGTPLHIHHWEPATTPRAAVQIAHGLAEHGGRYDRLARALNAAGYAVYANDHRGHGRTAPSVSDLGFLADAGGWRKCLDDLRSLHEHIATDHPGLPVVLLGHSLGSYLARHYASENGDSLAGLVLSAPDGKPSPLARAGRWVARLERLRLGPRGRSPVLQALSIGAYNQAFAPARTPSDWLSRDPSAVDAYVADPFCGFRPTVQFWIDLLDELGPIAASSARLPKQLPIHVMAGGDDPVSDRARGVKRLLADYRRAGLQRVSHRIYPAARHELFHEFNHQEATRDLITWLNEIIDDRPR